MPIRNYKPTSAGRRFQSVQTRRGIAGHTLPNSSIIRRACARSHCVSITTPPPALIRPELESHKRFRSLIAAKQ